MRTTPLTAASNQTNHVPKSKLTHELKRRLEKQIKLLYVNRDFINFIKGVIEKLPMRDKLSALYFFKKLAVQVPRRPDPDEYTAKRDEMDDFLSELSEEQQAYEPVKWITAEIEYLLNTAERLTAEDVNQRMDIMAEAKRTLSKDWLTKTEVMKLFGFSKATLNRRIAEGMPSHKRGKAVHFYLEELNEWMKSPAA